MTEKLVLVSNFFFFFFFFEFFSHVVLNFLNVLIRETKPKGVGWMLSLIPGGSLPCDSAQDVVLSTGKVNLRISK